METLKTINSRSENIGTIGSPSTTGELSLDILGTAVDKKLVGELAYFSFPQDGKAHYAMGQITEIELRNLWLEDATMRSLVRQRGMVTPVSGQQDTHLGQMTLSAVFSDNGDNNYSPSILGTVPSTGTRVNLVRDEFLDTLLARYKDDLFYLGKVFGSSPRLPLWFKHFGSGKGGAGEAYHLGIFGKTGSGKSVLAKMIMLAYSQHPEMSIFVLDPQGEFSKDCLGEKGHTKFDLKMKETFINNGKEVLVYSVKDLVLDRWELFREILFQSDFLPRLTISHPDNKEKALDSIIQRLTSKKITLESLYKRESFDIIWQYLHENNVQTYIFNSSSPRDRLVNQIQRYDADQEQLDSLFNIWKRISKIFTNAKEVGREKCVKTWSILSRVFDDKNGKPIVVINLSDENAGDEILWNDKIQAMVIKSLLKGLNDYAKKKYSENKLLNSLVVIDEAHRLAPRERIEDESINAVKRVLIDAVRTTRKYGLGWMFISQTLSSLDRGIIDMLRIMFFGFGLSMGTEFMALRDLVGGDKNTLKLYQSFRDPQSTFDMENMQYSFMTIGPVSPLSFSGTPLFFNAYNTPEEFFKINKMENSLF